MLYCIARTARSAKYMNIIAERSNLVAKANEGLIEPSELWAELNRTFALMSEAEKSEELKVCRIMLAHLSPIEEI